MKKFQLEVKAKNEEEANEFAAELKKYLDSDPDFKDLRIEQKKSKPKPGEMGSGIEPILDFIVQNPEITKDIITVAVAPFAINLITKFFETIQIFIQEKTKRNTSVTDLVFPDGTSLKESNAKDVAMKLLNIKEEETKIKLKNKKKNLQKPKPVIKKKPISKKKTTAKKKPVVKKKAISKKKTVVKKKK